MDTYHQLLNHYHIQETGNYKRIAICSHGSHIMDNLITKMSIKNIGTLSYFKTYGQLQRHPPFPLKPILNTFQSIFEIVEKEWLRDNSKFSKNKIDIDKINILFEYSGVCIDPYTYSITYITL